jgi:nitroreductase
MAVCPTGSIHIPGLSYESDFYTPPKLEKDSADHFYSLIASRRATRNFQDKPVPREALEKIVLAIQSAPPGFPPIKTEVTVIQDRETLKQALPMMIGLYEYLLSAMANPIARLVIKNKVGRDKFITMKNHVVPLLKTRMQDLKSGKEDTIMRRAPALILLHADRNSENYIPDIYIALTFGFLAAHSLGLGASAMDLIPPAVEKSSELRKLFQIPEQNEVVASMIIGYPKFHFTRGIRRELKKVTWIEEKQEANHA